MAIAELQAGKSPKHLRCDGFGRLRWMVIVEYLIEAEVRTRHPVMASDQVENEVLRRRIERT